MGEERREKKMEKRKYEFVCLQPRNQKRRKKKKLMQKQKTKENKRKRGCEYVPSGDLQLLVLSAARHDL